jgi:D-amino-acid oxidase
MSVCSSELLKGLLTICQFRIVPGSELDPRYDSATAFTSVCINTPIYLSYLAGQCLKNGVIIKRGIASHVSEAANFHHSGEKADIVINCTGLGSQKLGGVKDKKVYPARGQIVVVRNDPKVMTSVSGTDDGSEEATYIMQRAAGTLFPISNPSPHIITKPHEILDAPRKTRRYHVVLLKY